MRRPATAIEAKRHLADTVANDHRRREPTVSHGGDQAGAEERQALTEQARLADRELIEKGIAVEVPLLRAEGSDSFRVERAALRE